MRCIYIQDEQQRPHHLPRLGNAAPQAICCDQASVGVDIAGYSTAILEMHMYISRTHIWAAITAFAATSAEACALLSNRAIIRSRRLHSPWQNVLSSMICSPWRPGQPLQPVCRPGGRRQRWLC